MLLLPELLATLPGWRPYREAESRQKEFEEIAFLLVSLISHLGELPQISSFPGTEA